MLYCKLFIIFALTNNIVANLIAMTAYTKFKEYIWLVNTIYQAKAITLSAINEKWMRSDMSGGAPFSRTTFFRHKCAIEDIFGIIIDCDKKNGNKYFIDNDHVLREDSVQNWMLSTLSVGNMVEESQSLFNRILLEHIPSGGEKLHQVIKAMKESKRIMIAYRRYASSSVTNFTVEPYCVKLFGQRWYLLGRLSNRYLTTYSFDRMKSVQVLESKYKMPEDFDAADYFQDSYGIVVDGKLGLERVVLRAYGYEPYYLRDLPLHHSQREINITDEYSDFELKLKLTTDFKTKLLSRGQWLEVLEPQSLADEIVEWHENAVKRYKKQKKQKTVP